MNLIGMRKVTQINLCGSTDNL
ncbi:uncharacterized protein CELE_B0250.18 [Caenorhabditis elegans]|uniref:Uncharacterized protein n=1 Tax=Caenorhabditis elegans TaxID=6239 RepID=G1K0Y8_CAEEL|nr:Uncharacterized protein CELE_B0250.18 [Caenorhabditis elegans]CCC42178.1 Uncharacterized protein CELE_B0250.18 [Caenorhabditis elegans]|eukprot:NP_001294678.1 Uncharacterized protein CELE_B0250.18 [Caenorhabditis elegans]